jgi:hypothetical protein
MFIGAGVISVSSVSKPTAVPLLIDSVANVGAAYSLRKISTAYSGSAIRVRRSNDNAEQNIGFSGTNLDTATLATFVGANSGFVVTWYDQSGNSKNATQSTTAKQPRIVNAGTLKVNSFNSKPEIDFTVSGTGFAGSLVISSGSFAANIVYSALGGNRAINGSNNWLIGGYAGKYDIYTGSGFTGGPALVSNKPVVQTGTFTSGVGVINWVKGINSGTGTVGYPGTCNFGAVGNIAESHFGGIQEAVFIVANLGTSTRETIEANQTSFYNIS